MVIQLTMIQTLALAVVVLYVGRFMLRHVAFLRRFCIPEPVVGGLLFSFVTLYAHMTGAFDLSMDMTLKDFFMTCFFTAAGFGASLKPLKEGGKALIVFLLLIVVLVFLQNFVAVVLAPAVGVSRCSRCVRVRSRCWAVTEAPARLRRCSKKRAYRPLRV